MKFRHIDPRQIVSDGNLRHRADEDLAELGASIEKDGLLQPIIVRPSGTGYSCIAGHRRLAALRGARDEVPCVVVEADAQRAAIIQLAENIHRSQLSAREIVTGIEALRKPIPNMTREEAAQLIGKPASWVQLQYRAVAAYEDAIAAGADPKDLDALPAAHVIRLALAPPGARKRIARRARLQGMSARQVYLEAKSAKGEVAAQWASDHMGEWKGRFGIFIYDRTTVVLKLPMAGNVVALKQDLERLGGSLVEVRPPEPRGKSGRWGKGGRGRNRQRKTA